MKVSLGPPTRSPDKAGPCRPLTAAPAPLWQGLALRISVAPLLARVRRAVPRFFFFIERRASRAGVRTKVRMRESLARSRCSQVVKKKPLPINHDFYEMLTRIFTVCRVRSWIS